MKIEPWLLFVVAAGLQFAVNTAVVRMLAGNFELAGRNSWKNAIITAAVAVVAAILAPFVGSALGLVSQTIGGPLRIGFIEVLLSMLAMVVVPVAVVFDRFYKTGPVWAVVCGVLLSLLAAGMLVLSSLVIGIFAIIHPYMSLVAAAVAVAYPFLQWRNESRLAAVASGL